MTKSRPRLDPVLIQAVIAGALSFAHLHDLAEAAGQHGWKAWAYPVSVDLLLVAAWRRLRSVSGRAKTVGWCWFLIALAASLGANIATAGLLDLGNVPAWLRVMVAGWPAVAFFGGTLLAHTPSPAPASTHEVPTVPDVASEPAPVLDAPAPGPAAQLPAASAESSPVKPTPDPAPEPVAAESLPAGVPVALVDHARKVADAHQARTGSPIDTDTLRARLGVPAPMATAIAAQL
ncbi:DUF2637 domain-containing protein [Streptomyces sp. 71268]|uniref:DUF2637 domain-containing protein n=1 Tax=Streptomyces sp. 71268 TaxID=3002640 RepID=UPI0023FA2974|nr:DUF2637 domain-containing protein [Streptomyces sp. 71268]WEV26680.1 DUF2637 domain-containing protein [Streptomyces sp. 71268]